MPVRSAGAVLETSVGSLDRDRETAGSLARERRDVAKRYQVASLSSPQIAGGRYQSVALTTTGGSPVLEAPVPATSAGSLATERRDVAKRHRVASPSSPRIAGGRYQSVALTTTGGSPVLATSAPVPKTSAAALVMERWGVAKRHRGAIPSSPRTAGGRYLSVALTGGH